ncbi:hypothetical protein FHR92_001273 [Fontibacillus solani]|uniref:Uncharacterized protein n=2 Tax=Fontibacillus TaxID=995014 RepID=A0A1G7H637_9BACL|nr:hypothetical protein [Fontibacillus solani]SDE95831.1 hypothetical protein SAMN04488542_10415 [Fontibacillus panacisegetis]
MEEFLIMIAPQAVIVITVLFLFLYASKYRDPAD